MKQSTLDLSGKYFVGTEVSKHINSAIEYLDISKASPNPRELFIEWAKEHLEEINSDFKNHLSRKGQKNE
jgi:hypothetical protein